MFLTRVFVLVLVALPFALATTCSYQGMSGVCQSTSTSCAGGYYESAPICPGAANIQCCIKKPCSQNGITGHCADTKVASCSGSFSSANLCPGDSSIECCLPPPVTCSYQGMTGKCQSTSASCANGYYEVCTSLDPCLLWLFSPPPSALVTLPSNAVFRNHAQRTVSLAFARIQR